MNSKIENIDRLYGNIQVYSPNMEPMFKTNMKKVKWYLEYPEEKLAEVIEWENDKPKSIRLTFEPNGLGHFFDKENADEYFLSDKENICVVSGDDDWTCLTKHHIVPSMFRKWFPLEYKSRNCHDIVLITQYNHFVYERFANQLKDDIAIELGLPTLAEYSKRISRKTAYVGMATAILNPNIPFEHKIDLCIKFQNKTNFVPTTENLNLYIKSSKNEYRLAEFYGKMIVENVSDLHGFVERWRKHFIDTMNPQYMPKGWKIDRNMYL